MCGPSFIAMKRFLFFLTALLLLIASEYYFLTEVFTRKRLPVVIASLACVALCIFVFLRFFRKSVTAWPR